ncbi:protein sorting system archaetidylserine decarboxylase [Halococcus saccharolyticus]|uniref:Putative archaetidylserine decarboxylase proenzyme n=1 Tax=Halococcus saccharolyticus DSM 5350 TaxID=1227455 RepID=M0MEF5_9EURY|nr:protein sorting system archaetidylserine decarboxylase [Halococcus saccharolyticus]EMA43718.1 phosphatidylserine decarboxylase [Halococcus saccharolyticus DSM 5350]
MRIASHAWRYAAPAFVLAPVAGLLSPVAGVVALALAGLVLVFHRDPERQVPSSGIVAPADGRVSVVRREGEQLRVGIYMGVTDVHVNRAPLAGTVREVSHSPGANRPAFSKESDRNENVEIDCGTFSIVQIAGAFARRIHPSVEPGDEIARGERIGHISFGSRVDVVLPEGIEREDLDIRKGERVVAGETVLAEHEEAVAEQRTQPRVVQE